MSGNRGYDRLAQWGGANAERERFVARQLREGRGQELGVRKLDPADQWLLSAVHFREQAGVVTDMKVKCGSEPNVAIAVNPKRCAVGAFRVELDENRQLPFEPPTASGGLTAEQLMERRAQETRLDLRIGTEINAGSCATYEQLVALAPDAAAAVSSLKRIQRFATRAFQLHTQNGIDDLRPEKLIVDALPSEETWLGEFTYLGLMRPQKGGIFVSVVAEQSEIRHVRCSGENNLRMLKLLQAGQLLDMKITGKFGKEFDLRKHRFVWTLIEVENEGDLLRNLGPLASVVDNAGLESLADVYDEPAAQ